jgi:hypothetical protein
MTWKPVTQGDLDGTCGIYSIINAIDLIWPDIREEERASVFKFACMAIKDRFPDVLWNGTTRGDVAQMLSLVQKVLRQLSWRQPFLHNVVAPANFGEFSESLAALINNDYCFAIVGLEKPWEHWSVAHRLTRYQMIMTDSCHLQRIPLRLCGLKGDGTEYEFNFADTFTLSRS